MSQNERTKKGEEFVNNLIEEICSVGQGESIIRYKRERERKREREKEKRERGRGRGWEYRKKK